MLLDNVDKPVEGGVIEAPCAPLADPATRRTKGEVADDTADWFKALTYGFEYLTHEGETDVVTIADGEDLHAHAGIRILGRLAHELFEGDPATPGIESLGIQTARGQDAKESGDEVGRSMGAHKLSPGNTSSLPNASR